MEREPGGRELRRIRRHAHLRSLLPDGSEAASKMDSLLASEVELFTTRASKRIGRKIDSGNLAAIIIISLFGGGASFALVTFAQALSGVWAWVLWAVFIGWTLFVLLLVFVGGLPNLYKTEDKSS
ncbi:hypothetical protein [Actinomyces oricola]